MALSAGPRLGPYEILSALGTMPELAAFASNDPREQSILNEVDAIQRSGGGQAATADAKR